MRVHFDPNSERAFVFVNDNAQEYILSKSSFVSRSAKIRKNSLYRHCSSIEIFEFTSEDEIEEKLRFYTASNIAQLVRNALELHAVDAQGAAMMLKLLHPQFSSFDSAPLHLFEQLARYENLISMFKGDEWKLSNVNAWRPYRDSLTAMYSLRKVRKVCHSWQEMGKYIKVPEEELFAKGRQKSFFSTLYDATNNEVDLNNAYLEYCGLVGNIPRKAGSLESQFFCVFGGLSRNIRSKKKTYAVSVGLQNPIAAPNTDGLSNFLKESNKIREKLEASLSNLAIKFQDLGLETLNKKKLQKGQKEKLEVHLSELNSVFHATCFGVAKALGDYFQPRHPAKPRITIKAIDLENDDLKLYTIFRDHKANYSQSTSLDENTGFQFALKTGQLFLSNNVHASYKVGIYKNPRLTRLTAANKARISSKLRSQNGWLSLWKDSENGSEGASYRSTMILPINISRPSSNSTPGDRIDRVVVTAFLCIDHETESYFNPKIDLDVMQSGAGLFRTYLTNRHSLLVSTRIILNIVDRLKGKFSSLRIESNFESRELDINRLLNSIEKADSKSTLSFVDYGLRYLSFAEKNSETDADDG